MFIPAFVPRTSITEGRFQASSLLLLWRSPSGVRINLPLFCLEFWKRGRNEEALSRKVGRERPLLNEAGCGHAVGF